MEQRRSRRRPMTGKRLLPLLLPGLALALIAGCTRSRPSPVVDDDPEPRQVSVAELAKELADRDPDVRFAVVLQLRRLGPKAADAVPALTKALRDRDLNVRSSAADALASIGPAAAPAVPALMEALKDSDSDMRRAAAAALGAIGPAAGK